MVAILRAIDWARTGLGSVATWPQSLRTALDICLSAQVPMQLWWGPEATYFHNDACHRLLGPDRGRQALGRPGTQAAEQAMAPPGSNSQRLLTIVRDGSLAASQLTASFSPVRDEASRPGGVLGIITEAPAQGLAERDTLLTQLQLERARLDEALRQMPCGCAITDAAGHILFSSEEGERILGHVHRSASGYTQYVEYGAIHASGRPYAAEEYPTARALLTGEHVCQEEMLYVRGDGTRRMLSVSAGPIRDAQGRMVGAVCTFEDITDRKHMEAALRMANERNEQSLAQLQAILGSMTEGLVVADPQGNLITWNRAALTLHGYQSTENAFHHLTELADTFVLQDLDGRVLELHEWPLARALRGETFTLREVRLQRRDSGTARVFSYGGSPVYDKAGHMIAAIVSMRDVTERVHYREALRESEERFQAFMQHSPVRAFIKDEAGRYLYVNRAVEKTFHRPLADWIGKTDLDFFPVDLAAKLRENDRAVLTTGEMMQFVEPMIQEDGEHHVLTVKFRMQSGQGRPCLGGIALDVTEQQRAEQAIRESEERFRSLADSAPVLIWVNGLHGCEFVNRMYLELTGCTQDELLGTGWLATLHPDDVQAYTDTYERARAARALFEAQVRIRRADGEYGWWKSIARPRYMPDGTFLGYVGCSVDITDMKRSEQALQDADRRKNEFLAMLAHELRNPLAPIRNAAQILRLLGPAEPRLQWGRGVIERQVENLSRMVDDLLDISRISQGKVVVQKQEIELATVVTRAVETSRPLIDARKHTLTVLLPPEPVRVEADLTRLAQVLSNLLNNAAKYTEEGGQIWLSVEQAGNQAIVRVKDTGVGISASALPQIFDLFAQIEGSLHRAQGGLGIGLTLVRSLVELHGGKVEAYSAGPGQGSEFVVRLPLLAEAQDAAARALSSQGQGEGEGENALLASRRIVVVDDNLDAAESMALLLELGGHAVELAHDGPSALQLVGSFEPELVLLDIGLPGLTGYEVARELRQQQGNRKLLLVAMTGYGQEEDRQRARAAGFDHHLVKPVDYRALKLLLETL